MTTPTIKETKCPKCGADSEELPLEWNSKEWRCASHVRKGDGFYQSSECIERERDDLLKERAAALENTRPSSPIADRLADALKALLEEANAYASLTPASEEGSPSGEAEAILAEYDAQRSSDGRTCWFVDNKNCACDEEARWKAGKYEWCEKHKPKSYPLPVEMIIRSSADGWVSVEERLPEKVCLTVATGFEYGKPDQPRWAAVATFDDGTFYDEFTGEELLCVTHWRSCDFPQPPKGVTTEPGVTCWACGNVNPLRADKSCRHCNADNTGSDQPTGGQGE